MKKLVYLLAFCLAGSFFLGISGAEEGEWKTYKNEKYGFEIKYPGDWELSFNEISYGNEKGFDVAIQPHPEVLQRTGQMFPPSIGVIGRDLSGYEKDWEFAARSYFESESEGSLLKAPEKVNFKDGFALKGVKIIPIDEGAYLHTLFFPSPDGKRIFNILLQKFNKEEDYFDEVYNSVVSSFNFK